MAVARGSPRGRRLLLCLVLLALGACAHPPAIHGDAAFPVTFSQRQVLFEGEVVGRAHRSGEMGHEGCVVSVAVRRVWAGTCWGDTVHVHFLAELMDPGVLHPHATVVVAGSHRDGRASEIWGRPAVWNRATDEFRYEQGVRSPGANDVIIGREIRAFTRTQMLEDAAHGLMAARDSEARELLAVVACRLAATHFPWGRRDTVPARFRQFAVLAGACDSGAVPVTTVNLLGPVGGFRGDTIVVPVTRAGLRTGIVRVTATMEDLRVRAGVVPYFGMSYADLARATLGDSLRHGTRLRRPAPL